MLSFKDHIIINKYSFEYFKTNLDIGNNFDKALFFEKKKVLKMGVCALILNPTPAHIYFFLSFVRQGSIFTSMANDRLEDYVTFTRASFSPVVKSWCDWCSIINGYWSFLINAINNYCKIPANAGSKINKMTPELTCPKSK